jgi:hypothetical protein
MMPYQVYQLYQAERTKTAAEIRLTDQQVGELSQALSSVWHRATRPIAVAASGLARLAGKRGLVRRPQRPRPLALRRADYLTGYRPCLPSGRSSAPGGRPGQGGA